LIIPIEPSYDAGLSTTVDIAWINSQADAAGVSLERVDATQPVIAEPLREVRVGLYGGGGAPFNHAGVLGEAGFRLRFLTDAQVRAGELDTVDIFVMPGGGFRAMHGQLEPLGIDGARILANWVRAGGMYVGSCAGAYDCAVVSAQFVATCPPKGELKLINSRVWNEDGNDGGELEGLDSPGVGVLRLRNTRPNHPVMAGMPESFDIVHYNGPVFEVLETSEIEGASLAEGLAAFDGKRDRFTPAEHFMGERDTGGALLVERASAAGRHSVIAGELGIGRVVAFGSHPEFGFNLAMDEWGAPARMLVNAALWQATSRRTGSASACSYAQEPGPISAPRGSSLDLAQHHAHALIQDVADLRSCPTDPAPAWMSSDYAMSVFGLSPVEIWDESLTAIEAMANQVIEMSAGLRDVTTALGTSPAERDIAMQVEHWVLSERPVIWKQDGGYQGVIALLREAQRMCRSARDQWNIELGPPDGPYAYFQENPFHLVAGSYLAAVGCVGGAVQLLRALTAEVHLVARVSNPVAIVARIHVRT
jgi:hypothetical protein